MNATSSLDLGGLEHIQERLADIVDPDATPLMATWMRIIEEDNRKGVLEGTDKDGNPMAPVTYRPKIKPGQKAVPLTVAQRLGRSPRAERGKYQALAGSVRNNNLTSAEYRLLNGPPLAPRRQFSRVITNLLTDYDDSERPRGRWEAWGYWDEVVSTKGIPFLKCHFTGEGQKVRDLRGLRPAGIARAKLALRNWAIDMVKARGTRTGRVALPAA